MQRFSSIQLYDYKEKKCNFHTHTTRCKHATGTEREYVENAIKAGYEVLGFSDHAPYLFGNGHVSRIRMDMSELEGYVKTVETLKGEYQKDIQIFTGLEMEFFPNLFPETIEKIMEYPMDYMILGQHYFTDEDGLVYTGSKWEEECWLELYVNRVVEGIETGYFMYVAHPDIIHYVGDRHRYEKHMRHLARQLKKHQMPVEINLNGYQVGKQYPNLQFLRIAEEEGCDFLVGVDAHAPEKLLDKKDYEECIQLVKTVAWK